MKIEIEPVNLGGMKINLMKLLLSCTGSNLSKEVYDSMSFHLLSLYPVKTIDRDQHIHLEIYYQQSTFIDWQKYYQGRKLIIPTRSYFSQILPLIRHQFK